MPLSWKDIETSVRRNFGGFLGDFKAAEVFLDKIKSEQPKPDYEKVPMVQLLKEAVEFTSTDKEDSRYLLIITKNNAALKILSMEGMFEQKQPMKVLYGSSFPGDLEYSTICNNINRIKTKNGKPTKECEPRFSSGGNLCCKKNDS